MEAEDKDIRTVIAHGFGAWANVYRERRLAMGVIQRMSQKKGEAGDIGLGAFVHLGKNNNGPMITKPRKKTEEEYVEGFYGLDMPAGAGTYGISRRNLMSVRDQNRCLRADAIAHRMAELTLEKARIFYKQLSGSPVIPEEKSFEAVYKLTGLPYCKVIVAFKEDEPLSLVKLYPDIRKSRIVYVFVGNAGPYDVDVNPYVEV